MCGIAGFHLKHPADAKSHEKMELFASLLLTGVEQRGRQATGFVASTFDGKKYVIDKRACNAKEFIEDRKPLPKGTRTFLGHTRFATQGSNDNNGNLHPVIAGSCLATHNGGIWNDDTLFDEHKLKRSAEVDTEIIPALIHKFGWEQADKALHELRGSFAIAAIDLKHPGEVLLAKGDYSPLYWIETDHFVTWSSTYSSIQDAWKIVLGTPPQYKKFNSLKEGDMLWLKQGVIEPAKFELPSDPFRRSDNPARKSTVQQYASGRSNMGGSTKAHPIFGRNGEGVSRSINKAKGVVVDRREEVLQLRKDGYGKAILHGEHTHDELLKITTGGIKFYGCPGCGGLILEQSYVYRHGEGRICTDCNYIAIWGTKTATGLLIDEATRNHLDKWCKKEVSAHTRALYEVARQSGLEVHTVDYLVFRLPEKYANDHPIISDLAAKLDDLYQEAYTSAFDDVLDNTLDGDAPPSTGGNCYWDPDERKWVETSSCTGCYTCKTKKGSEDEKPWGISKPEVKTTKCGKCKKWKSLGKECRYCKSKEPVVADVSDGDTKVDPFHCWCGEEADRIIGGIVGFCFHHYTFCNQERCEYGISLTTKQRGVRAKAVVLLNNGTRVCHNHSRSVKGATSDTELATKGVIIRDAKGITVGGL